MVSQLNTNGFSLINNNAGAKLDKLGQAVSRELAMSGYGAIAETDVGYVVTHAYDAVATLHSLAAIPMAEEAKYSSFAVFRDAIADEAERLNRTIMSQPQQQQLPGGPQGLPAPGGMVPAGTPGTPGSPIPPVGNFTAAQRNQIILGSKYTGFYADLFRGECAITSDLLNAPAGSIEANLDFSKVNFGDPDSVHDYLTRIQEFAGQTNLRDHLGANPLELATGNQELAILLHTANTENYTAYIQQFEQTISEHFQAELAQYQSMVRSYGFKGDIKDVEQLKAFCKTLPAHSPEQYTTALLCNMTRGNVNQVDRYILARINSGDIDIQKILTTGKFNGVQLDAKSMAAFAALNVYANSDAVATAYHNRILEAIGYKSKITSMDLNNLNQVRGRLDEFVKALSQNGLDAVNGRSLQYCNVKQLQAFMGTKEFQALSPEMQDAFKQYLNLRDHEATLSSAKNLMKNFKMRMFQAVRKVLGDSDLSQGLGQVYSQYRNVKLACHVAQKVGAFGKKFLNNTRVGKFLKNSTIKAIKANKAFLKRILGRHYTTLSNAYHKVANTTRKAVSTAKNVFNKPGQQIAQQAAKKGFSKLSGKITTQMAKGLERKLLAKAGHMSSQFIRHTAQLALHGTLGTTGGVTATVGGTAAVGTTATVGTTAAVGTTATVGTTAAVGTTVAVGTTATAAVGTTAAAGATVGTGGIAAIVGGVAAAAVVIVLIIVIIICMLTQIVGSIFMGIAASAMELDNTLIGKIISFIENFKWPWECDEEDRQNVLWYTLNTLLDEERKAKDVNAIIGQQNLTFTAGFVPSKNSDDKPRNLSWTPQQYSSSSGATFDTTNTQYVFVNTQGDPINEYSNVKLVISMAHAYTYQMQHKADLEHFSLYAVGLWRYINNVALEAKIKFCSGDGSFTYYCKTPVKDSSFYTNAWPNLYVVTDAEKLNGISVSNGNAGKFYVVGGDVSANRDGDDGCTYVAYYPIQPYGCDYIIAQSENRNTGYKNAWYVDEVYWKDYHADIRNLIAVNAANVKITKDGYKDSAGNTIQYFINPTMSNECWNHKEFKVIHTIAANQKNFGAHFCAHSTSNYPCNNSIKLDTYSEVHDACDNNFTINDGLHSDGTPSIVYAMYPSCSHGKAYKFNQCKGHTETMYCYGDSYSGYTDKSGTYKTYDHASTSNQNCGNQTAVTLYTRTTVNGKYSYKVDKTIYVCQGHTNHGHFTDKSVYVNSCTYQKRHQIGRKIWYTTEKNYDKVQGYQCRGYSYWTDSGDLYVCQGHMNCYGHNYCYGHTVTYCTGHMTYKITRKTIPDNSEALYNEDWTHVVKGQFLWWTYDTVYSPKHENSKPGGTVSLARDDWAGWTQSNRECASGLYTSDWYQNYQIGTATFVGAKCSEAERSKIKETYGIDTKSTTPILMQNLNIAFDAIGRIPYYPGDYSETPGIDSHPTFNTSAPTVFDKNGVQRGVHGLDPKNFAAWVYINTHDISDSKYSEQYKKLTTYFAGNTLRITDTSPKPGTPIVYRGSTGVDDNSGIYIGTKIEGGVMYVVYVGININTGWATICTAPASGWYFNTKVCE